MVSVAQRLAKAHIKIEDYQQTIPNLTAATSNLFDLIQARQLVLYPDANMRTAASRAVLVQSSRGQRLDKLKQNHKIDVIVALSMACLAAVKGQNESSYDLHSGWLSDGDEDEQMNTKDLPTPDWKLARFESEADAEAFKAQQRALYNGNVTFWDGTR
jgi:phage terminase large subunit-like protein